MTSHPNRYVSADEDSARWVGFPFRPGDIVISTRSKSGTTWMQMICALLIFQTPDLPAPLSELSPWLDWLVEPRESVYARLEAQEHRRFVKTHTPLDGVPFTSLASYVVVVRHPLDMAVSLYHQGENINRTRLRELTGQPEPSQPPVQRPALRDWLLGWIDRSVNPCDELDSLPGVLMHAADAWARRAQPNVILVHYDDLSARLDAEMRRIATRLGIGVDEEVWPRLVESAGFGAMRAQASRLLPDPAGVLRDPAAFFRRGTSGAGRDLLTTKELEHYDARVAELVGPAVVRWLHHVPETV